MAGRHAAEGVPRAGFRDGAFVAVETAVVANLEEKGAVAEAVASLGASGATDAKLLIDGVFVIRVLDEGAFDGGGGTGAVLGAGVEVVGGRLEIAGAKLAIPANGVGMDALDGGLFEDAVSGAVAAADALLGVDLPNGAGAGGAARRQTQETPQAGQCRRPRPVPQKLPAMDASRI